MTHYVPAYAPVWGVRERAICGDYVFSADHSLEPTCPHCKALIDKEGTQHLDEVSISEVVERH